MNYEVTNSRDDKVLIMTADEVQKYVGAAANKYNYGYYRYWELDGAAYYDCGPITYTVRPQK